MNPNEHEKQKYILYLIDGARKLPFIIHLWVRITHAVPEKEEA